MPEVGSKEFTHRYFPIIHFLLTVILRHGNANVVLLTMLLFDSGHPVKAGGIMEIQGEIFHKHDLTCPHTHAHTHKDFTVLPYIGRYAECARKHTSSVSSPRARG